MGWVSLGQVQLSYNWTAMSVAPPDSSIFRITQSFADKPTGAFQLAWDYGDIGKYGSLWIYPDKDRPRALLAHVPVDFVASGFNRRMPLVRIAPKTRVFAFDWVVGIEAWNGGEKT